LKPNTYLPSTKDLSFRPPKSNQGSCDSKIVGIHRPAITACYSGSSKPLLINDANALGQVLPEGYQDRMNILHLRAEQLPVQAFVELTQAIEEALFDQKAST
jgi:hypothetical protein